jgi:uncharacterized protein (TIGR00251 family)
MFEDAPRADPDGRSRKTTSGDKGVARSAKPVTPVTPVTSATLLHVKVVPGSRKDAIVGALGDRLKVKVAAAPEEGKANAAVCGLIAARLGLKPRDVTVVVGHASAEKTLRIEGLTAAEAEGRLACHAPGKPSTP